MNSLKQLLKQQQQVIEIIMNIEHIQIDCIYCNVSDNNLNLCFDILFLTSTNLYLIINLLYKKNPRFLIVAKDSLYFTLCFYFNFQIPKIEFDNELPF